MITFTEKAAERTLKILEGENPKPEGIRISVVGGGCSGFSYRMEFVNEPQNDDNVFEFGELKIFVDPISLMYIEGSVIDYNETLSNSGFQFNNPNVKTTCGCGSSFDVQ